MAGSRATGSSAVLVRLQSFSGQQAEYDGAMQRVAKLDSQLQKSMAMSAKYVQILVLPFGSLLWLLQLHLSVDVCFRDFLVVVPYAMTAECLIIVSVCFVSMDAGRA